MKMTLKMGKLKFYKLEAAAILTGMVLMLIGNLLTPSESEPVPSQTEAPAAATPQGSEGHTGYAEYYASQIERLLANIEGIGEVPAVVYVKSEGTGILAENSNTDASVTKEEDSQGGTREETKNVSDNEIVILKDKDGNETV